MAKHPNRALPGFTLTELLTVVGVVSLLLGLLLPSIGRVRAASNSTACLSRLRQMGNAWTIGAITNGGQTVNYSWSAPGDPTENWNRYWVGQLTANGVSGDAILCPGAREPIPSAHTQGFGNVSHAWTGKFASNGSVIRMDDTHYRSGSYGYNRYLTSGAYGTGKSKRLGQLSDASNIPVFMDCAYADVQPQHTEFGSPPDLQGSGLKPGVPAHWLILLARHGRGINMSMADGSARWVVLDDLFMLSWDTGWRKYRLQLPRE